MGILEAAGGTLLGMAVAPWEDQRQLDQQEKMMGMQIKGQKEMTKFNREQALQMWKDTNYSAQAAEMRKAGLNVASMYGGSGAGGATASIPGGQVTGGNADTPKMGAGMGMQIAQAMQMNEAQKELIEAQTEKTKAETAKTSGADTELTKAQTQEKVVTALQTQMENEYMGAGAYKDGMSGYEVRAQREAAEMYNTVARTEIEKLKFEQMPVQLANETQKVLLEGQRVAIDAMNARTQAERNQIIERIESLKRNLAITLQGNEMYMRSKDQAINQDAINRQNEQKDEDQILGAIDKTLSAVIPWYQPSTTITTTDGQRYKDGSYRTETRTQKQ